MGLNGNNDVSLFYDHGAAAAQPAARPAVDRSTALTEEQKLDIRYPSLATGPKRAPIAPTTEPKLAAVNDKSDSAPKPGDASALNEDQKLDIRYPSLSAGALEIKLPAGVAADKAVLAEYGKAAKEAGLTSDAASKLAAWDLARSEKASTAAVAAWEAQDDKWVAELTADPNFEETIADAKAGLERFGGGSLGAELRAHGLGNHPGLIRLLARAERAARKAG